MLIISILAANILFCEKREKQKWCAAYTNALHNGLKNLLCMSFLYV
jgi:hypothetical protein